MYDFHRYNKNLYDYFLQLELAIKCLTLPRVPEVMKTEALIDSKRKIKQPFYYAWFMGVANEARGRGTVQEIMKFIFNKSREDQLPIYAQTALSKNRYVLSRYGFDTYDEMDLKDANFHMYFMKRAC